MKISKVYERNIKKFYIYTKLKPVSIDNDYQIFPKRRRFFCKIFLNIRNVFRFSPFFEFIIKKKYSEFRIMF